jgi:pimeloyl-ACP methyl ester carboxylesterase
MAQGEPLVLIPGLLCSARLYAPQIAALWPHGPIMVADHRRDAKMNGIAERILAEAPPRFALAGLSMGGYIAFAMMRVAPKRITRLALLDTSARPDTPEQTATRKTQMAMAESGKFDEIPTLSLPRFLHRDRQNDAALVQTVRQMAKETGPEAFVRQQKAIMSRSDSLPLLASIRCPTLVLVGDGDVATPPDLSREIAAGVAGAKLVVVPNCGHLSTIERPDAVNAATAEWLA